MADTEPKTRGRYPPGYAITHSLKPLQALLYSTKKMNFNNYKHGKRFYRPKQPRSLKIEIVHFSKGLRRYPLTTKRLRRFDELKEVVVASLNNLSVVAY